MKLPLIAGFRDVQLDLKLSLPFRGSAEQLVEEAWLVSRPTRLALNFVTVTSHRLNGWRRIQDRLPIPLNPLLLVDGQQHLKPILVRFNFQPGLFQS